MVLRTNLELRVVAAALLASTCACVAAPPTAPEPLTRGIRIELGERLRALPNSSISVVLRGAAHPSERTLDPATAPATTILGAERGLQQLIVTCRAQDAMKTESLPVFVPAADFVDVVIDLPEGQAGGPRLPQAQVTGIDLRSEIAARGLDVRNQGARGTCSVFAMTFLLEYQYSRMFGPKHADLSEQYLNYQAQVAAGNSSASHCDGAFFWMVKNAFDRFGAIAEEQLAYTDTFDFDADAALVTPELIASAQARRELAIQRHGLDGWFLKSNDSRHVLTDAEFLGIKHALRLGLPVAMGRGHSVALVGYDDREQVFVYRNSYGTGIGEGGYATYTYEDVRNQCYDLFVNCDSEARRFANGARPAEPDAERPAAGLQAAVDWLSVESRRLIRAARREMHDGVAAFPPQVGSGYEAFWLRDYAYMLEGCPEAFSDQELLDACRLFVNALQEDGSGVDCVKYDGTPIYKPGYGTMGANPVTDGGPFTVAVAWHTHQRLADHELLEAIIDPLVTTLNAVPRNPTNGLVHIEPEGWERCPYGFTDTVRKQGDLLFSSLLWIEAAQRLAELLHAAERPEDAVLFTQQAEELTAAVRCVLFDEGLGLFRAATLHCAQPDIWGSAFAVQLGVASDPQADRVARYFQRHYDQLVQHGQVRHLPPGQFWDQAGPRESYQNGGYWAAPAGWFATTLERADPNLAHRMILDLVADFQDRGVCEWVLGDRAILPNYLASATLSLAGARALLVSRER